jgi:hypothetical protein
MATRRHSRARIGGWLLAACLGLFATPVPAADWFQTDWKDADTEWQVAYLLLHAVDWGQTRMIARNPEAYYEINPLLGEHPSVKRVDRYMAMSALAHTAIAYALPPTWRRYFQRVTLSVKAGLVDQNYAIGLTIDY